MNHTPPPICMWYRVFGYHVCVIDLSLSLIPLLTMFLTKHETFMVPL